MKSIVLPEEGWIEELTRALSSLARIIAQYDDELSAERELRSSFENELIPILNSTSDDLCALFSRAQHSDGRSFREHYSPLLRALQQVLNILVLHPTWIDLVESPSDRPEIWIELPTSGGLIPYTSIIGGLMARAMELSENGFRVASEELNSLLTKGTNCQQKLDSIDLKKGYHVLVFQGLKVDEEVQVDEDTVILPFNHLDSYVNESVLKEVVPLAYRFKQLDSVSAIVKPFSWCPQFQVRGDFLGPELDWDRQFFVDAMVFVRLLALSHSSPVLSLLTIPFCIHRTAMLLLGKPHNHSGYNRLNYLSGVPETVNLNPSALSETQQLYVERKSSRFRDLESVITRLSEALVRSGRFHADDKILDVAIALEQMYELDRGEISYKLKTRAACLLESDFNRRKNVFQDVSDLYEVRSGIVHRRSQKKKLSTEKKTGAFDKGFQVARRTVVKLVQEGSPRNWNEIVLAGSGPQP